jgi:hypothetical protein
VGFWHGWLLAKESEENMNAILSMASSLVKKFTLGLVPGKTREQLIAEELDTAWRQMEAFVPRADLEEMEGLAAGMKAAGVTRTNLLTLIHRIHAFPDLGETSCSALYACGTATADQHAWQIRILDYGAGKGLVHPLITVRHPAKSDELTYTSIGWAGFVGAVSGVNEKGVCVSEMGLGNPPGERLDGIPMIFLLKQVFRYSRNTRDAAAILQAAERNNSYAYWVGDPSGDSAALLTSPDSFRAYWINKQDVVRELGLELPQYRDVSYGGHFCVKQGKIVAQMLGRLNLSTLKEMAEGIAMPSNLQVVIFDLTSGDLWVANARGKMRAADCEYVHFPRAMWSSVKDVARKAPDSPGVSAGR